MKTYNPLTQNPDEEWWACWRINQAYQIGTKPNRRLIRIFLRVIQNKKFMGELK